MLNAMKSIAWILFAIVGFPSFLMAQDFATLRKDRERQVERGLWREIVDDYSKSMIQVNDEKSGDDLQRVVDALRQINAWAELDGLVERAVASHPENPDLLVEAAVVYQNVPHSGKMIAGEFVRGGRSYGRGMSGRGVPGIASADGASAGEFVITAYRDRIRELQLLRQALQSASEDSQRLLIWDKIAPRIRQGEAWKLQTLTPLDLLPEWGELGPEGGTEGAPWAGGAPVLYQVPASWEVASNDGERWRFALAEETRLGANAPKWVAKTILERARFSESQFGTGTLAGFGWWQQLDLESAKGILAVDTLAENECLAKTSDGVRRFKLPGEQHFIALYRSIMDEDASAGDSLVQVFLNRRQFESARATLERTIAKHGPGNNGARRALLKQITGNWGRFEAPRTVAAGTKPRIPLVFRNATNVHLTASPVNMDAFFNDAMTYLKSNPKQIDWERFQPSNIANRLNSGTGAKYIGKPDITWESALIPAPKNRETRTDLEVPVPSAGAWWITGKIDGGNTIHTLVWIVDSVIVQHDVAGVKQWWVTDAATGAPVVDAEVEFFGYRNIYLERKTPQERRNEIKTNEFSRTTDSDGKILMKPGEWKDDYQYLALAHSKNRSTAFYGFQPYNVQPPQFENGNRDLSYGISDRPLYKPGDTVHLKFFFRNVGYSQPDESRWANHTGTLTLSNGRGETALKIENVKTNDIGAAEAEVVIPKDAVLGKWNASYQIKNSISANVVFSVEEYRKPEYEVSVEAPKEPVVLGDKFTATVKANYFHGTPVRNAEVEVIVKRSSMSDTWFPPGPWDWLYGAGAWWNGSEASWHPTWKSWGCVPPHPSWWQGNRWTPDELVLKKKMPIGQDGTATVEIDTALAKQIHSDMDAKYSIEARVVDASRREERGTGGVVAARKPFQVIVWTDHGFSASGDIVTTHISAATLTGKAVTGAKGTMKLLKISLGGNGHIDEKELQSWPIETDADGKVLQRFAAPEIGQYRLAVSLSIHGGDTVEGASILNVQGPGRAKPEDWKFGPLELISDKTTYSPGETVKLRVNSDHADANVWLFLHIAGTSGREARRIQLNGKSLEVEVPVNLNDMPNMFIEGVSVFDAEVHRVIREILLPPVSKIIDVTLTPAKSKVKPREHSSLRVNLRDADGKPVQGTAVLAIYDKALEAITGGSNVSAISENFWGWKNNYFGNSGYDSIPTSPGNLAPPKSVGMQVLGRFGNYGSGGGKGFGGGMLSKSARGMMPNEAADGAPVAMFAAAPMDKMSAGEEAPASAPILVRKDFADLLKWSGTVETDAEGNAEVSLEFPDNLTTWKARVWVLGKDTHVGEGSAEIITSKDLLVRLQAPRFLVERDVAIISAIVENDHDNAKSVKISLELDGKALDAMEGKAQTIKIAANSEARVDWKVKAVHAGEATIRMRADAGDDGDAVERKLPVLVHGMLRQDAWSRTIEPDQDSTHIAIEVPEQRRPDQSKLTIRFSPSVAGAVVDAIPYLASYPHGCTEQTLNRFVPAVIAQNMLRNLKINLAEVKAKRSNLNPQELGNSADRAAQWRQWQTNPVFDEVEMEKMIAKGVDQLMQMQNSDGGWGWFSGYGESSYPHTTAVVVHGLLVAKLNGAKIPNRMLDSGVAWLVAHEHQQTAALQRYVDREALRKAGKKVPKDNRPEKATCDAEDAFVRMVLGEAGRDSEPMLAFLYRDRLSLPVYGKCLLGLEENRKGDESRRDEVILMISQFLKRDAENQTAWLDLQNSGYWWNWYGSEVEAHAWFLKLLTAAKPKDPDTRGLVKYLVNNRKHASYWESTRDTAFAIEAIAGYFKASGEDAPEMEVEVLVDGKSLKKISINRDNLFSFDGTVVLSGTEVTTGKHDIELRRTGHGTLYANAYLQVFTLEDKFRAAGLEVKVARHISKLIPLEKETEVPDANGTIVKQNVERFRKEPLKDGDKVKSGDRIEVELVLESKNDYEYLIFSDAKAAGFEALQALSGYIRQNDGFSAYMEPRDQTVDFFIRALPRGTHTIRYQLRAETPGTFKALPATAEAMYAPELRANSEDIRLQILK